MVVIRLSRGGSNKNPFYHIVVTDSRKPRDSGYIERIGYYNPMARGSDIRLQVGQERIAYWLSKGAKASERVSHLLDQLKTSPEDAQKAGLRKGEMKKLQEEAAAKAYKEKIAEAKKAEKTTAEETKAEAAEEVNPEAENKPAEVDVKADEEKQ